MNLSGIDIIIYLVAAIFIPCTAVVYSYVLIQTGEIFGGLYGRLHILFKTDARAMEGKGVHPVFKAIMWCEKCVAGQMALWFFLIWNFDRYMKLQLVLIIPHILLVGFCIFMAMIIKKIYITRYE